MSREREEKPMKLRLLLTKVCNRRCRGCCNKDWNLDALPVCTNYSAFNEFLLTGGEPLLYPQLVKKVVADIRRQSSFPIYMYTAMSSNRNLFFDILNVLDGITLTLHGRKDLEPFKRINEGIRSWLGKKLRLNVFKGIPLTGLDLSCWKVKPNMYWVKNAPLPDDEVFMRLM